MSKVRKVKIVEEDLLYSREDIMSLRLNEEYIRSNCTTPQDALEFFAKLGLIKNNMECKTCLTEMSLVTIKRLQSPFVWVCKLPCRKSLSVYTESFFEKTNICFTRILLVLAKYLKNEELQDIVDNFQISRNTLGPFLI